MRQDTTRQDQTRPDKSKQDQIRQDKTCTRQKKTRQDETRQDKTRQDKTRQDLTRQHKTRQDNTRQQKTRQDHKMKVEENVNPEVQVLPIPNASFAPKHKRLNFLSFVGSNVDLRLKDVCFLVPVHHTKFHVDFAICCTLGEPFGCVVAVYHIALSTSEKLTSSLTILV
jgi:hypothetical protein